jgi:hypothetical protein
MNTSKHDIHKFDPYIKILGNKIAVILFTVFMASIGILLSIINSEWLWFSRFGSLITVAGLLLISSPSFVKGIYLSNASAFGFAERDGDGNTMVTNEEDRKLGSKIFSGIVITIIGTVIWGFGDLIGKLC